MNLLLSCALHKEKMQIENLKNKSASSKESLVDELFILKVKMTVQFYKLCKITFTEHGESLMTVIRSSDLRQFNHMLHEIDDLIIKFSNDIKFSVVQKKTHILELIKLIKHITPNDAINFHEYMKDLEKKFTENNYYTFEQLAKDYKKAVDYFLKYQSKLSHLVAIMNFVVENYD